MYNVQERDSIFEIIESNQPILKLQPFGIYVCKRTNVPFLIYNHCQKSFGSLLSSFYDCIELLKSCWVDENCYTICFYNIKKFENHWLEYSIYPNCIWEYVELLLGILILWYY